MVGLSNFSSRINEHFGIKWANLGVKFISEKPTSQAVKSQHPWIRHIPL